MVTLYEDPHLVSIKEILEKSNDNFRYIERFEYGDYDNWVTAVIDKINIPLHFTRETKEKIGEEEFTYYWVSLETIYKSLRSVEDNGLNNASSFTGYSSSFKVANISDILNRKVEVIGEWKKEL